MNRGIISASGTNTLVTVAQTEVFTGTSPTTWTDLDLSGTVGANHALVFLKGYNSAGAARRWEFRTNGDTDDSEDSIAGASGADVDVTNWAFFIVATDSAGIVEWITEVGETSTTVDVVAYIK